MTHAYDIHGILSIESDEPLHNPAFHDYFRVDVVDNPDIVVRTDADPWVPTDTLYRHDNWFYGRPHEDKVYYEDRLLGQNEAILLQGLDGDTTIIEANTIDFPDVTPGSRGSVSDLVEAVIDFKLLQAGHTTIHAASLSKNGDAVLLAGFPNVGKTLSTLHLLQDGYAYMGDDNGVISADGTVLAYPSTSSIGYHDFLKYIEPESIGRGRYYRHLARVYPMQSAIVERLFDYPEVYLPDIGFEQGDTATGRVAACLEIGEQRITEESPTSLATKIVSSTDYSRPRIWQNPFLHVWAYFNANLDELKELESGIVRSALEEMDCYTLACQHRDWDVVLDEVVGA